MIRGEKRVDGGTIAEEKDEFKVAGCWCSVTGFCFVTFNNLINSYFRNI